MPIPSSTSSLPSTRGVARVGAIWLIVVGVLLLAALAFAFIVQSDLAQERRRAAQLAAQRQEAEQRFEEEAEAKRNVSVALGWYDRESADPLSDIEAARTALEELKSTFPDLGAEEDFQEALPKILAAFDRRGTEIDQLKAQITSLESELSACQEAQRAIQQEKDQLIADLRQQLSDEQQTAQERVNELEDRLAAVQQQLSDRDAELRQVESQMREEQRAFKKREQILDARIASLQDLTKFTRAPFRDEPDARVIETSRELPLAWIDVGANQRLARGMRFRIEGGSAGSRRYKGWAQVERVEPDRASIEIVELADPYDPVVPGDVLVNPLYDPTGTRNAVLVGRFSGAYTRGELEALLDRLGIRLQQEVGPTTHFLIVGAGIYEDPETGESLEEPLDPADTDAFKKAESLGVSILPIDQLTAFFQPRMNP